MSAPASTASSPTSPPFMPVEVLDIRALATTPKHHLHPARPDGRPTGSTATPTRSRACTPSSTSGSVATATRSTTTATSRAGRTSRAMVATGRHVLLLGPDQRPAAHRVRRPPALRRAARPGAVEPQFEFESAVIATSRGPGDVDALTRPPGPSTRVRRRAHAAQAHLNLPRWEVPEAWPRVDYGCVVLTLRRARLAWATSTTMALGHLNQPSLTRTSSLPKFRPASSPRNASGAFSRPSTTSSR